MNEKQFLEMSPLDRGVFVKKRVFGHKISMYAWDIVTTWRGLGKGIEHANENEWYVHLNNTPFGNNSVTMYHESNMAKIYGGHSDKNIFLAFWIAYLKALGVLE